MTDLNMKKFLEACPVTRSKSDAETAVDYLAEKHGWEVWTQNSDVVVLKHFSDRLRIEVRWTKPGQVDWWERYVFAKPTTKDFHNGPEGLFEALTEVAE